MKLKKTVVSMLSISALVFSLSTPASAEVFTHSKPFKQASDIQVKGIETVGEWNKTISTTGGEITLDTVQYKYSTVLSITGYQEAQGTTARVRYQIREKVNNNEVGPVKEYLDVFGVNGYFSRAFNPSTLSAGKTYVIQATNYTSSPVILRGNAVVYYD
ncbi:hypothetical protein PJ311_16130 [Bacillus sp. CLL-7-23]|uniref:Uncharacterized protein n=1 Tax=Bacillus changyiensis TaxID=3004103 RepID=A0ABT4X798_9BACI|nr:hypothetical protein [Bacillus changyiensis]MDA7028103.1 hypothetical protein [Bacillus changyiensis]